MSIENFSKSYIELISMTFAKGLSYKDLDVLKTISEDYLIAKFTLLISRRTGEGELDIFCGYYRDQEKVQAVFISLCPSRPVMLLDLETVKERIENLKRQNLHFDQSQEALASWPT